MRAATEPSSEPFSFLFSWGETDPVVRLTAGLSVNGTVVQSVSNQGSGILSVANSFPTNGVAVAGGVTCNDDAFSCDFGGMALAVSAYALEFAWRVGCPE